jgi:hypothetical protein
VLYRSDDEVDTPATMSGGGYGPRFRGDNVIF